MSPASVSAATRKWMRSVTWSPKLSASARSRATSSNHGHQMAVELLTSPSSFVGTMFDRAAVSKLLDDHSSGDRNEQPRIWTLLSLEVWHRELVKKMVGHTVASIR